MSEIICIIFHRRFHVVLGTFRFCKRCDEIRPPHLPVLEVGRVFPSLNLGYAP